MAFKELFKKYKVYTIISIIAILLLVAGGVTAGLLIGKQGNEQLNVPALAADFTDTNGLEYTIRSSTDLTVSVSGYSGSSTTVVIPETVVNGDTTYTVTTIAGGNESKGAFANKTTLTSITIPSSITTMQGYAFYNCTALTEINFNATNMNDLFSSNRVFYNAGQDGAGITVSIGANVTKIPACLFSPYSSSDAPKIVTVNFAEGSLCESIGNYAFSDCSSITSITIPNSVTSIGNYAFNGCSSLTEVTIPDSVTSIGSSAFYRCSVLTSITIPNSVTSIGERAFDGCYDITSVYYLGDITGWVSIDFGDYVANPLYYADNLYLNGVLFTGGDIVLDTVTSIGAGVFYGQAITSATIGNQVTSIGEYAFSGCGDLSTIVLGNGLTEIGYYAFSSTPWLTNIRNNHNGQAQSSDGTKTYMIIAPNTNITSYDLTGVYVIAGGAFSGCSSLTSITIPDSVTSIGEYAFYDCTALIAINFNATNMNDLEQNNNIFSRAGQDGEGITVNIGANVTKIPAYLFCPYSYSASSAPKIVTVTFAENSQCESIGEYAFYRCSSLIEITIPESVTNIGNSAFQNCSSLIEITIPESVASIGSYAFYSCSGLTEINFNAINMNDLSSYNYVFYNAGQDGAGITVNIGANVTKIPAYLFNPYGSSSAPKIVTVTFAENSQCESIGEYAFYRCSSLIEITIPDSVTSIGNYAFCNCSSLIEITIPESVTNIGKSAFQNCSSLIEITIPESVASIGSYAFSDCSSLTEINFNAINMNDLSSYNYVFYNAGQDGAGITVNIGANVTKIPVCLFYTDNSSSTAPKIVTVNFAENSQCESIGNYAFYYCGSLSSITIPDSVTSIGNYAFCNCSSLTSITIPNSVTSIGNSAFCNCSSLTSITIPNSVTSIGSSAFENCSSLTEINFNATNMNDLSSGNDVFSYAGQDGAGITVNIGANVTKIPAYLFSPFGNSSDAPKIVTVNFAENSQCESIGEYAFYRCSSLIEITIPDSVTSIGNYAFRYCSSLTSVKIGNSVTSIGNYAFRDCSSLTEITIPDSVTSIGEYAFSSCSSLTSATIGNSVTSIGERAFYNCTALTEINFNATNMNDLSSGNSVFYNAGKDGAGITVNIGANVTKIPAYLFNPYNNSVYVPKIVTVTFAENSQCASIGEYAFRYGSSLTSITIPNSVTSIGEWAFSSCIALTEIIIPESITSMGEYVFYYCRSLNNVYFYNDIQNNTLDYYIGRYAFNNNADTVTYWVKDSTSLNNIRIIDNDDSTKFTSNNFQVIASLTITTYASLGQILINGELTDNYYETLINGDITLNNLIAVPKANCAFLYWLVTTESGSKQVTDNPLSMTITETTTITAVFTNSLMDGVGVTALGGGQVRMGGYEGEIDENTQVTLNAICYSGYTFDGWYLIENGVETKLEEFGNSDAITINVSAYEGKLIIAKFTKITNEDINEDLDNS